MANSWDGTNTPFTEKLKRLYGGVAKPDPAPAKPRSGWARMQPTTEQIDPAEQILQAQVAPQSQVQATPEAAAPAQPSPQQIQAAAEADFAAGKYPSLLHALSAHGSQWAKAELAKQGQ